MGTAYEFLKDNHVFHLATVEGNAARVRPFGFAMVYNNRLYICTNKTKDVFRQMQKNPDVEISCMSNDGTWLRIRGKVTADDSYEAKAQAFKESPTLLQIYPKGADDETYITLYFTDAAATLYSFTGAPQAVPMF